MNCPFCHASVERAIGPCGQCGNDPWSNCRSCGAQRPLRAFCPACGEACGQLGSLANGTWCLVRILGKGGMGQAWLARDSAGEPVVVKAILEDLANDPGIAGLFVREALALSHLRHPGVPRFLGYFQEAGRGYMVQEWIPGPSLAAIARAAGGALPVEQVVPWLIALCGIVDYLHGEGMVHRDIKPDNILLHPARGVVLIDFGAVKDLGGEGRTRIATPGYTPPEQAAGHPVAPSDLYAIAATGIHLLTGVHPVRFFDRQAGGLLGFDGLGMPPKLAQILAKAGSVLPADRHSSARELKLALSAV